MLVSCLFLGRVKCAESPASLSVVPPVIYLVSESCRLVTEALTIFRNMEAFLSVGWS